jgi:hypothetical protein
MLILTRDADLPNYSGSSSNHHSSWHHPRQRLLATSALAPRPGSLVFETYEFIVRGCRLLNLFIRSLPLQAAPPMQLTPSRKTTEAFNLYACGRMLRRHRDCNGAAESRCAGLSGFQSQYASFIAVNRGELLRSSNVLVRKEESCIACLRRLQFLQHLGFVGRTRLWNKTAVWISPQIHHTTVLVKGPSLYPIRWSVRA